jgi:NTE family protein
MIGTALQADTVPPNDSGKVPLPGAALCLSGGGYRAMLFHVGTLWRLNDAGLLPGLKRISSVSGGSITAAYLASKWDALGFPGSSISANFEKEFVNGLRSFARHTIDIPAVMRGVLLPGSVSNRIIAAYKKHLFGDRTLQDLPDHPRFVLNASNMQSGALWRFSKTYMRDWRVGSIDKPTLSLATAVAASSAFPPFLSPVTLKLDPAAFTPGSGDDLEDDAFRSRVVLTDGGVYDNLGLETVLKNYETVLVSDAGARMAPKSRPPIDWACQLKRVIDLIDSQVRALRKRDLMDYFTERSCLLAEGAAPGSGVVQRNSRLGAYWSVRTDIADYKVPHLDCPFTSTSALAAVPTRLSRLPDSTQERLINWGYAVCDAALRAHVDPALPLPAKFPCKGGV